MKTNLDFCFKLAFTQWVSSATRLAALFFGAPALLFVVEENDYSASSRLADTPKNSTAKRVQLLFLG